MSKIKFRFCLLLSLVLAACIVCGTCLLAFAEGAANEVDANGWNTMVTRGGEYADGGHRTDENYYSTYTDLQDGDQITYGGTLDSKVVDYLASTSPFRFDIAAKGEGSVTWTLSADNAENERVIVYSGTMNIGGSALAAQQGIDLGGRQIPVVPAGQPLSLVFAGFSTQGFGGMVYYDLGAGFQDLGLATGSAYTGVFGGDSGRIPESFYLTVTVVGNVEEVSVKAGTGDLFTYVDASWGWPSFKDGFATKGPSDFIRGVLQASSAGNDRLIDYLAFRGYEVAFYIGNAPTQDAYVTVGGTRVDSDGTASEYMQLGLYTYTIPLDAEDMILDVSKADYKVTYMNGNEKLLDAYVKANDLAYEKDFAIQGKVITGWYTDSSLETPFNFETPITQDTVLYAATEDVLVVNFRDAADDALLSFTNVTSGNTVAQPADPQKAGMTFVGWYTDKNGETEFDFDAVITESTDVYAIFAYNVTAKVIGYNGPEQSAVVPVVSGDALDEADMPTFGEITKYPEYTNIQLVWYADATMAQKLDFGDNGIAVDSSRTYYAAVADLDQAVAEGYVRPNADGWDRNRSGGRDSAGNTLTADQVLAPNSKYGSAETLTSADGYSDINIDFVGYIANARRFDVEKDIFLSYTLDSRNESANDQDGPKHDQKYFFVGMFNSLTGALVSQGQLHENDFGAFAVFGHRVNTEAQEGAGGGKLDVTTGNASGTSADNSFVYEEGEQVDLKISVGTENTKIYQLKKGEWAEIATMNVTRAMFPDGLFLVLETTRITWINARATQVSTVTQGAANGGTFTIDTPEALSGGLYAGDRVYFTATPAEGYEFTVNGVYANGTQLTALYDEGEESYYFNMPFGTSEITFGFGINVTFMADGQPVGEPMLVVAGEIIDIFDVNDPPAKTGHRFVGWFADEDLTEEFDFDNTPVTEPITLYAKYEPVSYTITFMDGGTRYLTATAQYGAKYALPEAPTKEGYTFGGWFTDAECTQEYDFDTAVTGNVTVYAKWTQAETPAPVDDSGCGGCGSSVGAASVLAGVAVLALACVLLRKKAR